MSHDPILDALQSADSNRSVEGALRAIDPDDTRVGERLWKTVESNSKAVAGEPASWRYLAQAPPGSFSAVELRGFFRAASKLDIDRLSVRNGRLPWDATFDAMVAKVADDPEAYALDDGVEKPLVTGLRVAMVRHGIAEPHTWGEVAPREWLEILLPVWDRFPGYADEFTRFWKLEKHGSLAVNVAARRDAALQTTDFLHVLAPYTHPEERIRIVLNVASPHAMERALAVLEENHRANMAVLYGSENKWFERVFDDFGSALFGAHGVIGGPGILGLLIGLGLYRLFEIRFAVFVLTIILTFAVWRVVLALSVRPALPFDACRPLASSKLSLGLLAGWIVYRRSLAGKQYDPKFIEEFCFGLIDEFPELGRPSRLRTVIEINLSELPPDVRDERVLQIFGADDSIERWAVLEFAPTPAIVRAAIDATTRFEPPPGTNALAAAPPAAQEVLSKLAARHQALFLEALDEGRGAEEVLVFAIGHARGDGVLDSLGRKLGDGSDAMREAIVTALSNYGQAAVPGVERALADQRESTRRDGAEVAWRLEPSRALSSVVASALVDESNDDVARILKCAQIRHAIRSATTNVEPLDVASMTLALDDALATIGRDHGPAVSGMNWSTGTPVGDEASRGLAAVVEAFDGTDARLLPLMSLISNNLELACRDRWAKELLESDADLLASIAIAGPAATLSFPSTTESIEALARMATPAALIRLDGIAHDDPDPGLRQRAFRRLYQAAGARGVEVSDVFELAVLELPPEATIDPDVAEIVELQAERVLAEAMVAGHRWRMEKWRALWADSPLFENLVGRLVWAVYDYGLIRETFRMDEGGDPVDVDDEPVKLREFTEIGLPVGPAFDQKLRERWSAALADYEVVAPFAQLDRSAAPIDLKGLALTGASLRRLLSHGWFPSTPGLDRHYGFLRPFPRLGITASLEISPGIGEDLDEPQSIDTLAFVDGIHSEFPSISRLLPTPPPEAQTQVTRELWQTHTSQT